MAKRREQPQEPTGFPPADSPQATAELPPPADPTPNGDPAHPAQPARTGNHYGGAMDPDPELIDSDKRKGPRKARDPNAPRPLYLLIAIANDTQRVRLLGTAPTVGQASKLVPAVSYGIERGESGPLILRCKLVSAVGRRTRKAS